ncbi:helix-turn-helix domain-containing protein [Streptomonospora sediminis]
MSETETAGRPPRSPALRGIVDRFWYVSAPDRYGIETKLPTPTAQLVVNLDAPRLSTRTCGSGPAGTATAGAVGLSPIAAGAVVLDRSEQRRTAGVVIRPEAVGALAGIPAHALGPLTGLDILWGSGAERLQAAAGSGATGEAALDRLETALVDMVGGRAAADPCCRAAIAHLRAGASVRGTADRIGVSQSTLNRRFRAATGLTAKRCQRLLRLDTAVRLAAAEPEPDWPGLALAAGFYDQAHLVHEFADLAGISPTRWHRAASADPFHVRLPAADDFLQDARPRRHDHRSHE